jgi:Ca-activated chloride channel family protein
MFRWPANALIANNRSVGRQPLSYVRGSDWTVRVSSDASHDREGVVPAWRTSPGGKAARYVLATILCAAALTAQTTVFKTKVQLVHVIATVKNPDGQPVGALEKSDFTISDNGVRQEIAFFQRTTEQALSIVLLIDTSGSTAKDLKYETDSAAKFLHVLLSEGNPQDAVALYSFNYEVREEHGFTRNYTALENRLKLLHGEAGTSLYDAIHLAARALEPREGRKVIVVITDGGNTTSSVDIQTALKEAQFADAVIYPVVVIPITNEAGRNTGGEHSLIFMAQRTGGRTFFPDVGKLDKAFADIITELRTQYLLSFYPQGVPLTKDPYHKLQVATGLPDLRVSARDGYYGDAEGAGSADARTTVSPNGRKKRPQQ